jgi:hypothetical protein
MGWHTRHASTSSGLEGHLRPETLNLTAWNHALAQRYWLITSTRVAMMIRNYQGLNAQRLLVLLPSQLELQHPQSQKMI